MTRILFLTMTVWLLCSGAVYAQEKKTVQVSVTDAKGEPLPGATVAEVGTRNAVTTNLDGKCTINVVMEAVLEVSFIGYDTRRVTVTETSIEVQLEEGGLLLDEVVVTALGIKRSQKALSYNVQEVNSEKLNVVKNENFVNQLTGKVAGLEIKSVAGGVGSATRVTLRGMRSITQSSEVLYVIDGIPVQNFKSSGLTDQYSSETSSESMADINPDDIESISALTGATASALYGWKGANGVILITTKKGTAGKAKLSYSTQATFTTPFIMPKFQNRYGNDIGAFESWGAALATPSTYFPGHFFNTGSTLQHSLSFSGGTERSQTFISGAIVNANGIIPNNAYDRYNLNLRNSSKHLNDKLTLDIGINFMKQYDRNMVTQGEYFNPLTAVYLFPRGEDFTPIRNFEKFSAGRNFNVQHWDYGNQGISMQNPYWVTNRNIFEHNKKRYILNSTASYQFFDWLSASARMRIDNAYTIHTRKLYATTDALFAGGTTTEESNGNYRLISSNDEQFYLDGMVQANKTFGDFSLIGIVGASLQDSKSSNTGIGGTLFRIANLFQKENLYQPGTFGDDSREQTQSVFTSVEVNWRNAVYLTLTTRNDWCSVFSGLPSEKTGFFYPSFGLSTIVSDLVKLPSFISYLKLRGSLAYAGGGIPRQLSERYYEYAPGNPSIYVHVPYFPILMYPGTLVPEQTRSWEGGMDIRFLSNALRLDGTYYHTNSFQQLINPSIASSTGYSSVWVQMGNIMNRGVELLLSYKKERGAFLYEPSLTASWNENKVIDLGSHIDPMGNFAKHEFFPRNTVGSIQMRITEGGSLGDLWSTQTLARDQNGNVWVGDNDRLSTEAEFVKMGSTMAKWRFGFRNDFSWKDVQLSVLFTARLGGQVLSRTQAVLDYFGVSEASADLRNAGGKSVNNGVIDAKMYYQTIGGTQGIYKYYLYSANNVRLQEIRLGYRLPQKWFGNIMSMNLSLVASNLLMIYNKAPFDPEATASTNDYYQGVDYFMQPSLRSIGFSVKIDF